MKTKTMATAIIASTVALMVNGVSYAVEPRSVGALGDTAMAVSHGEDGHADVLVRHAERALKDAEAHGRGREASKRGDRARQAGACRGGHKARHRGDDSHQALTSVVGVIKG
jgi:Small metal-binding protein